MRFAAMAAGALGGYFGARLAAAGHDVFFIARGAHRDAIAKNGLKVESVHGDLHLPKPNLTDDPAKVGPVDIVLFAVKLWDTELAAEAARPLLGPDSRLITFQNGIDNVDRLCGELGDDRVVGGAAYIATVIASPGVIKHTSPIRDLAFRPRRQEARQLAHSFVTPARPRSSISICPPDISRELWQKFIFLTAMAGSTASLRSSIGPIIADPELREFFHQLMEEAFAVGKAKGISLDHAYIDERMNFLVNKIEPGMRASMAHDLERGNRLELIGSPEKYAAWPRVRHSTPASDTVYTVLKLHRMGNH